MFARAGVSWVSAALAAHGNLAPAPVCKGATKRSPTSRGSFSVLPRDMAHCRSAITLVSVLAIAHKRSSARLAARLRDQRSSELFKLIAMAFALLAQTTKLANAAVHKPIHKTSKCPSAMLSITSYATTIAAAATADSRKVAKARELRR